MGTAVESAWDCAAEDKKRSKMNNQFANDGSFMAQFMAQQAAGGAAGGGAGVRQAPPAPAAAPVGQAASAPRGTWEQRACGRRAG